MKYCRNVSGFNKKKNKRIKNYSHKSASQNTGGERAGWKKRTCAKQLITDVQAGRVILQEIIKSPSLLARAEKEILKLFPKRQLLQ